MRRFLIKERNIAILDNEPNHDSPEGWARGVLEDLIGQDGIFCDGDWVESKDQDPNGDVRLIQLADIGDGLFKNKSTRFLTLRKAKELGCTFLRKGDVLIARMPEPLGRSCIFPGDIKPAVTAVDICIVRSGKNGANQEWIKHIINAPPIRREIELLQKGTTRKRISRRNLASLTIPIPPLSEQRRIAEKVEELLGRINSVRERLARVQTILKRFRQSVLSAACSGRLTADWRGKQEKITPVELTIKEILELREKEWPHYNPSSRNYRRPQNVDLGDLPDLPENWEYVSADSLFTFVTSGSRGWAKYYSPSGPIFIRIGNLDHDSISLDLRSIQCVDPPAGQEQRRTKVQLGDILISITADVGMTALVQHEIGEAYINQHIALARPVTGLFRPYLAWYLVARDGGQAQFQKLQRGATKVGLGLDDIKSVPVPFPPLEEQYEIVRRLEALFTMADTVEKRLAFAGHRADKIQQSILAKAFRGELVPNEAELARREGRSYEPASTLLARIKAGRGIASPPVSKKRKKRLSNKT